MQFADVASESKTRIAITEQASCVPDTRGPFSGHPVNAARAYRSAASGCTARALGLEICQTHPAILLAQRFGIIGLRQGEQGQLIFPNLGVMDLGADGVRALHGNSPMHFQQVLHSSWKTAFTFSGSVRSASCPAPDSSAHLLCLCYITFSQKLKHSMLYY